MAEMFAQPLSIWSQVLWTSFTLRDFHDKAMFLRVEVLVNQGIGQRPPDFNPLNAVLGADFAAS
jgi:hypothetical protein